MAKKNAAYQIIQEKTGKVLFEGAYVKYYPNVPYCAVFEEYPSEETRIWVCKKVPDGKDVYGYRQCRLVSCGLDHSSQTIGQYVKVCEVASEKEATQKIIANLKNTVALQKLLTQKEER